MKTGAQEKIVSVSFDCKIHGSIRERVVIYPRAADIILIEGDDNYSTIHFTAEYQKTLHSILRDPALKVAKTLKYFEEKLRDYGCFFRCSRGAIVNLHYVRLLRSRTIYLHTLDKAVFLSGELVAGFKNAMDRI
ncbi:MAG: hypothetical protein KatS3mg031_2291 [Chitinophagales bacterium]|nr:MAG: hypothetical protein KatS3mg031_2291 [Chitinophagales bacterium]